MRLVATRQPGPTVTAAVVICAYTLDRWDDLVAAVESACAGSVLPDQVIVAVDYNDVLLTRASHQFRSYTRVPVTVIPNVHRKGLSGARNSAVLAAEHDIVVFLDDDAAATPTWLAALLAHYADDAVVAVGGAASPRWPQQRPTRPVTLPAADSAYGELDWVIGCSYRGQPEVAGEVRNLMGCNMSFRRSVFERTNGFSEALGRIGKTPLGCEETEFCIQVRSLDSSLRIIFEPAALVRHHVSPDRMTWSYLLRRCFGEGVSKAAVASLVDPGMALQSERSYVAQVLPRAVVRELTTAPSGRVRGLLGAAAIALGLTATTAGYVRGVLGRGKLPAGTVRVPQVAR